MCTVYACAGANTDNFLSSTGFVVSIFKHTSHTPTPLPQTTSLKEKKKLSELIAGTIAISLCQKSSHTKEERQTTFVLHYPSVLLYSKGNRSYLPRHQKTNQNLLKVLMSSEYHQSKWGTAQMRKEVGHLLFVTSTDVHVLHFIHQLIGTHTNYGEKFSTLEITGLIISSNVHVHVLVF